MYLQEETKNLFIPAVLSSSVDPYLMGEVPLIKNVLGTTTDYYYYYYYKPTQNINYIRSGEFIFFFSDGNTTVFWLTLVLKWIYKAKSDLWSRYLVFHHLNNELLNFEISHPLCPSNEKLKQEIHMYFTVIALITLFSSLSY